MVGRDSLLSDDALLGQQLEADDFEIDEEIEPDRPAAPSQGPRSSPMQTEGTLGDTGERFQQRRFTGGDTLDEPVTQTIMRDVYASGGILAQTLGLKPQDHQQWDLWGPLVFCLVLSLLLSYASTSRTSSVFSSVFALLWLGQALVTLNIRLLGGTISWLHALCVSGYSLFPLLLAGVFSLIIKLRIARLVFSLVMIPWATWSATRGLGLGGVLHSRVFLASYPVGLFYAVIGWLCVVV